MFVLYGTSREHVTFKGRLNKLASLPQPTIVLLCMVSWGNVKGYPTEAAAQDA